MVLRLWIWILLPLKAYGDLTERNDQEQFILQVYWLPMHRRDYQHLEYMDTMCKMQMQPAYQPNNPTNSWQSPSPPPR